MLKPIAKAVYPVLRTFSYWEPEGEELETDDDFKAAYAERTFEVSEAEPGVIAQYAGISRFRVSNAMDNLIKHNLVERHGDRWKVYLIPPRYYKRDFLNEQIKREFGSEL